jgi:fermentation-respiration switch protein FrsA (DUF1100 family)
MRFLVGLILLGLALYGLVVAFFWWKQSALLYPAGRERASAAEAGLPDFGDVSLATPDGERIVAWYRAPQPGRAVLLYFHGNGGSLLNRRFRARMLTEDGRGLLLVSYRGYSGSTGAPSEEGLRIDARTAYDWLARSFPAARIVLYGESLGTGVSLRLATEREVGGVILDAPYTSTADIAGHHFGFLPVTWLMRDQYRSIDLVHRLRAPLLVMHGEQDGVIPVAFGERLFAAAPEPKRFVRLRGSHVENLESGGLPAVRAFLAEVEARSSSPPSAAP